MTNEEAIQILRNSHITYIAPNGKKLVKEAVEIAIISLSKSENPINHFGSIECPNCGQLLMVQK